MLDHVDLMARLKVKHTAKDVDVSVVMPIHNEEKTLNQCLTAVQRQRVDEIIIALDKCTDDSEKIAEEYATKDPRVKILTVSKHNFKTNYRAETMNCGISKAENDIICIVDADTILGCNYVFLLLPYLKKPTVSVTGKLVPVYKRFLQFFETIGGTGRTFFREVWEEVDGFNDIVSCDTFFDLELLERGYDFKVTREAIMYDIRNYSVKQLTRKAFRRGKGRRQLGQSFPFMLGHGLYYLTKTPFGFVELPANIIGYLTTHRRVRREYMKRYEIRRTYEIIQKLIRP